MLIVGIMVGLNGSGVLRHCNQMDHEADDPTVLCTHGRNYRNWEMNMKTKFSSNPFWPPDEVDEERRILARYWALLPIQPGTATWPLTGSGAKDIL